MKLTNDLDVYKRQPHGSLNNCTPAEVAGFASDSFAKNSWFSAA